MSRPSSSRRPTRPRREPHLSLANTGEPLCVVNRSGNRPSHDGCVSYLDEAIALCRGQFRGVLLRRDTDFSLTGSLDGWTDEGVRFVLGYDARSNLVQTAHELPERAYTDLKRGSRYEVKTSERTRRENVKQQIGGGEGLHRHPAVLGADRGVRSSIPASSPAFLPAVRLPALLPDDRPAQEPVDPKEHDLASNGAWTIIASLAWTLKAWFGLLCPRRVDRKAIVRMEFKQFLASVIRVPCQVLRGAG